MHRREDHRVHRTHRPDGTDLGGDLRVEDRDEAGTRRTRRSSPRRRPPAPGRSAAGPPAVFSIFTASAGRTAGSPGTPVSGQVGGTTGTGAGALSGAIVGPCVTGAGGSLRLLRRRAAARDGQRQRREHRSDRAARPRVVLVVIRAPPSFACTGPGCHASCSRAGEPRPSQLIVTEPESTGTSSTHVIPGASVEDRAVGRREGEHRVRPGLRPRARDRLAAAGHAWRRRCPRGPSPGPGCPRGPSCPSRPGARSG